MPKKKKKKPRPIEERPLPIKEEGLSIIGNPTCRTEASRTIGFRCTKN